MGVLTKAAPQRNKPDAELIDTGAVFLGGLLAVEAGDFPDAKVIRRVCRDPLGHFQIGLGFFDPLAKQRLDVRIKRLHR